MVPDTTAHADGPSSRTRRLFLGAFLAAAAGVAAVHGRGLQYDFVYDDVWTVLRNPALRAPSSLTRFFTDASTAAAPETGMGATIYRPLPTLTFRANFRLSGPAPWAWHLPNLMLHALNGALAFLLLVKVLGTSREAAALGAGVFLFHPVQVETAAWISQRSNLMCAAGGLAAILLCKRGSLWGLAAYAAALLSKETAATLAPFLVLAALSSGADRRRKAALIAGTVLLLAAYLPLRAAAVGAFSQRPWRGGFLDNLLVGQASWRAHLKLCLWPARLAASHRQDVGNPWEHPAPWIGACLSAAWAAGTLALWRSGARRAAAAAAWIPGTLALHLGLFPLDTFAAERFLYLPMVGFAALAGFLYDAFPRGRPLAAALLLLPVLSFRQTGVWRDESSLWRAAVRAEPDNAFARLAEADALYARGLWDEAAQATRLALTMNPGAPLAFAGLTNLSDIALKQGRPGTALSFAEKALRIRPGAPQAVRDRDEARRRMMNK